jgi:hypothetical protein
MEKLLNHTTSVETKARKMLADLKAELDIVKSLPSLVWWKGTLESKIQELEQAIEERWGRNER